MHLNKKEVHCHPLHITLHTENPKYKPKLLETQSVKLKKKKINIQKSVLVYNKNEISGKEIN